MPLRTRVWLALAIASIPKLAEAQDDKTACLTQHEQGQFSRREGKFEAAREAFSSCTRDACPALVRRRCAELLGELDVAQPSVVIAVHDAAGRDVIHGISMRLDGGSLRDIPVTALRIDPGEHLLSVVVGSFPPVDQAVVVREGEKDKRVDLVLPSDRSPPPPVLPLFRAPPTEPLPPSLPVPPPSPPLTKAPAPMSVPARVFLGVSIVSLVGAGATGAAGWGVYAHLADSCEPHCTASQAEPLRVLWPTSFVALGVGVVSGAIALGLVLTNRTPPALDRVGLHAAPGGALWMF